MNSTDIIKRKIAAASSRRTQASLKNSLVQNLEKSIAKVFLEQLHIETGVRVSDQVIDTHIETLDAMNSVLFGMVGFDGDVGLCGFDSAFINTVLQRMTGGSIGSPQNRAATNTDAALSRHLINQIFDSVFAEIQTGEDSVGMGAHETDKAQITFNLAETHYALLRIKLEDQQSKLIGEIELLIPLSCIERMSTFETADMAEQSHEGWRVAMEAVASEVPIELDTVVQRMNVSLSEILNMKENGYLELNDGSLHTLNLEGQTPIGPITVFSGKLGALNTQKALKISRVHDEIQEQSQNPIDSAA